MANKQQVIDYHRAHPEANSVDIGDALGCHPAYVRATAGRYGLSLPKKPRTGMGRPFGPNSNEGFYIRVKDDMAAEIKRLAAVAGISPVQMTHKIIGSALEAPAE